jgi:predicted dehydrogenase
MSVRFDDGALGTLMTGRRTPDYVGNDIMVYGSSGRAGVRGSIDVNLGGALDVRTDALTVDESYANDPIVLYTWLVDAFNEAVADGGDPVAAGIDGLCAAQVTAAMVESARTGASVKIQEPSDFRMIRKRRP